jgi:antitoxin component YwqK of YwqJK toxin-antitoxin module
MTMRWFLFCCLLATCSFSVDAAWFRSNSIGQKIEQIPEQPNLQQGWFLYVSDGTVQEELLYRDGTLTNKTTIAAQSGLKSVRTVTVEDFSDPLKIQRTRTLYENGLPTSISVYSGTRLEQSIYQYQDRILLSKKQLVNGALQSLTSYWRDSDGALVGMRIVETSGPLIVKYFSYSSDMRAFTEGTESEMTYIARHEQGPLVSHIWKEEPGRAAPHIERDDGGNLIIEEYQGSDLIRTTYDTKGNMMLQLYVAGPNTGRSVAYTYDESGLLISSEEIIENPLRRTVKRWYDGVLETAREETENGVSVKSVRFFDDRTSIVTLYDRGNAYVDVVYASDGKTVLSITYR